MDFLGKPAWQKKAEKKVPKSVSSITYVGDCNVGSSDEASNNPPQISASKRKFSATVCDSDVSDYEIKEPTEYHGYRLVYMESLRVMPGSRPLRISREIHGLGRGFASKVCPGDRVIRVLSPFLQNSPVIYPRDLLTLCFHEAQR